MEEKLKSQLKYLASKYETADFILSDPVQFAHRYKNPDDIETGSFIAAMLSFGSRKQFIPKIREILEMADKTGGIAFWLKSGGYKEFHSPDGNDEKKFYRFYSYSDMQVFFMALEKVLELGGLGCVLKKRFLSGEKITDVISFLFRDCKIVPKGKNSTNKRVHMFLRWMVRTDSPVDIGIWNWISPSDLIIPLDTHVIQESVKLSLVPENTKPSIKTAEKITEGLKEIWPEDPCKGDFALFGLGVDKEAEGV